MNRTSKQRTSENATRAAAARRLFEELESRRLMDATNDVALIDTSLPDYKALAAAVADRENVILYDGRRDTAANVLEKLVRWAAATKQQVHSVSILSHGAAGGFRLGKDWITSDAVQKKSWQKLSKVLADDASIYLFGCNVAADVKGELLLDHLAALSGADVYGSSDLTGSATRGGDWVLEASSRDAKLANAASDAVAPLTSRALAAWDFSLAAGIIVSPVSGLSTVESGGHVTFNVVLAEQPTATVDIGLTTSDATEGTVAQPQLTFTPANWNVPQTVTVNSVNDLLDDGNVTYNIVTAPATSSDAGYNGLNAANVAVTNIDDDPRGLTSGAEFRANTFTTGAQLFSAENNESVAMDAAGNFIVTWTSFAQDGSGYGVYAQRYDAAGVAQGGEFRVNTVTAGDQLYRSVAMDDAGNFVVVWSSNGGGQDGSGFGVYARRYNAAGVALDASEFRVNITTGGDQSYPVVAMDGVGNFVVAWVSGGAQDGQGTGIYARRFSAAGEALSGEFRVNTTTANNQNEPTIAMSDAGAFVIAWTDSSSGVDVRAQRYSAAGLAQGGEILVNTETFKDQRNPSAAMDAVGNFIITWSSAHQDSSGSRYGIFAQRFSAAGARVGAETQVNPPSSDNQRYSTVAMDDNGDYVIAWSDAGADGSGWGIFAQQYHADGTPRGGAIAINTFTSGDQVYPSAAMDASGDVVIVWTSDGQDGSSAGIYAQRFQGGNDAPVHTLPGAQSVNEDATLIFSTATGNLITVSDSDAAAGNTLRLTLTASNGLLTLGAVAGLTFTTGDGAGDSTMTFTGTLASINAALDGMSFTPTANYNGAATLQIATYDFGNSGWDGPRSDSDTLNITVNAVNDAPVNTVPGAQVIDEDVPLVLSAANANSITISDIDGGTVRVTLTATNGRLTLAQLIGLSFTAGDGADDAAMTFSGTLANINAALNGLRFDPSANFNGAAGIAVTTNDLGNTGIGGPQGDIDNGAISVNPVNDAPVNTLPPAQNFNEDAALAFSSANGNLISISDVDAGGSVLRVTLSVTNGLLTLAGAAGLSFATGDGTDDALLVFTGTSADINAALNGMTFTPAANISGPASLQITTDDQGNTGAGGAQQDSDALVITVNGVNDAPVNTIPPAQTIDEDTPLVFSAGDGNAITIADVDAGAGGLLRVTLAAGNGVLTLAQVTGLSFTAGDGTGDAAMTFTGTLADINAALDGLTFAPSANFSGAASVTITTNDQGNTGTGGARQDSDVVAVTVDAVNDAPVHVMPSGQAVTENGVLTLAGGNAIRVTDVDAAGGLLEIAISTTDGMLTLASLAGLTFTIGDGTNDAAMTFRGTVADVNAALDGMTFAPAAGYNGPATIAIATSDQGNTGSGGASGDADTLDVFVTAINHAPVNNVPPAQAVDEDASVVFSAANGNRISISDIDAGGGVLRVTIAAANGLLSLAGTAGLTFTTGDGTADAGMTFTGTLVSINAALDGLRFTPTGNFNGAAGVTITSNDLGNTGPGGPLQDSDFVDVDVAPVNDAPLLVMPAAAMMNEDGVLTLAGASAMSVVDIDAAGGLLEISLGVANGVLTLASLTGLTFTAGDGTGDAAMTFTGTLASINAALDGMTFIPAANYSGAASIAISTSDQGNTGGGGAMTDSAALAVTINPLNDAPANVLPPAQAVDEDSPLIFSAGSGNAITVTDIDGGTVRVTLAATNGRLTLAQLTGLTFTAGDGTGDAAMTFTGTLASVNAALDGLRFDPAANFHGVANVTITTNDLGNTGAGGARSDTDAVAITVNPVNDAPVNIIPIAQSMSEDGVLVFSFGNGNRILVDDIDAGSQSLRVTLTATNGLLTLAGTAGLGFTIGDGVDDATMTFTGSVSEINQAMEGLSFRPSPNFSGAAGVTITTNDRGNIGAGGAQSDADSINVAVDSTNDLPVLIATPGVLTYTENDAATIVDTGLAITDADDATIGGATVAISSGYVAGEDLLSFVNQNGITGSFNAANGVLTLSGSASMATYRAALRTITYTNTSERPSGATRGVQFTVYEAGIASNIATRNIAVVRVNDAPVGTPLIVTLNEDAGRSSIDLWQLFSDVDDSHDAVTLSVVGSTNPALFSTMTIDAASGQLNLDSTPNAFGDAVVTLRAIDAGGQQVEATLTVGVTGINDAPAVGTTPAPTPFDPARPTLVDAELLVSDADSAVLLGATVRVMNYLAGVDVLEFTDQNGITGTFDSASGVLTLTGSASVAQYEQALRSVRYAGVAAGAGRAGDVLPIEFSVVDDAGAGSTLASRLIAFESEPQVTLPSPPPPTPEPEPEPDPEPDPTPEREPEESEPAPPPTVRPPIPPHTAETDPPPPAPDPPPPVPPVVVADPPPAPPRPADPVVAIADPPPPAPRPVAPPPPPPAPIAVPPPPLQTEKLWRQLDELAKELEPTNAMPKINVGTVSGVTTTLLSVGYVIWCLRGGAFVATLLTTLPLWRWLDPLPVLDEREREEKKEKQKDEDEERIRSMME